MNTFNGSSLIVRVFRRGDQDRRRVVGIVELGDDQRVLAFSNMDELTRILMGEVAPDLRLDPDSTVARWWADCSVSSSVGRDASFPRDG